MGKIELARYTRGTRTAVIDEKTALWAARMLIGEGYKGEKGAAVLWATMNRYMYTPHEWPSYYELIRLFSQPINPRWLPGGDKFEKFKKIGTRTAKIATSDAAVARRKRIQNTSWDEMPPTVKKLVELFAVGKLPYPSKFGQQKISNFASYSGVERHSNRGVHYGKEYFFQDPGLLPGKISITTDTGQYLEKKAEPGPVQQEQPAKIEWWTVSRSGRFITRWVGPLLRRILQKRVNTP